MFGAPFGAQNGQGVCTPFNVEANDREESAFDKGSVIPGALPLGRIGLCWETNVLTFSNTPSLFGSSLLLSREKSATVPGIPVPFSSGQMVLPLNTSGTMRLDPSSNGNVLAGLPAIGFLAERYTNGTLTDGSGQHVLSNYGGAYPHHATVRCPNVFQPDGKCQ